MPERTVSERLNLGPVHLVGIKGTGMCALAELLAGKGIPVTGSDTDEEFYTDAILKDLGIPFREGFAADNIPGDTALIVHSAAYTPGNNPECAAAAMRGLPLVPYPEALGLFSRSSSFSGIAGIHGKTTTTAMVGMALKDTGLPFSVLVGSAVPAFGGRSTLTRGGSYFIAETCEYRRHFLNFRPRRIIVTNVEADHLDYYRDAGDVLDAFTEYAKLMPPGGDLIYCADDPGALALAERIARDRKDIYPLPYGYRARGRYRIETDRRGGGLSEFRLAGVKASFGIRIPGIHMIRNAAAAVALSERLLEDAFGSVSGEALDTIRRGLYEFSGCRRRSEILGEAGGVLFIDDYGHHPTEIRATLDGYREFYPGRRIIVDFMSHTYSRTEKLLDDFAGSFTAADLVILHKIYASAREERGEVDGRALYREVCSRHENTVYFEEILDAMDFIMDNLVPGDVFITMGAGNNWILGRNLLDLMRKQGSAR